MVFIHSRPHAGHDTHRFLPDMLDSHIHLDGIISGVNAWYASFSPLVHPTMSDRDYSASNEIPSAGESYLLSTLR